MTTYDTCKRGHEYTPENTGYTNQKYRFCRACKLMLQRARYAGIKATREHTYNRTPRVTACVNGHEYTPENTYARPDGSRMCRTCSRNQTQRRRNNMARAATPKRNARVEVGLCPEGHAMTEGNTHTDDVWGTQCVTCLDKATGRGRPAPPREKGGRVGGNDNIGGPRPVLDPAHAATVRELLAERGLLGEFGEMLGVTTGPRLVVTV